MTLGAFSGPNRKVNSGNEFNNHGFMFEWSNSRHGRGSLKCDHEDPELVPQTADRKYRDIGNWIHRNNEPYWDTDTIRVECDNCGDRFHKQRGLIRKTDNHFCKHECYLDWNTGSNHYNWEGGTDDYYGPTWIKQRRKAYERDGKQCQDCSIEQNDHIAEYGCSPHVHHIIPHRLFDDTEQANQLSNLVTLCSTCHKKHENWAEYVSRKRGFK